mgnify:CR=1 FL=1
MIWKIRQNEAWLYCVQVSYREESKGKIARQLEIAGKTATDEELEQMLEVQCVH